MSLGRLKASWQKRMQAKSIIVEGDRAQESLASTPMAQLFLVLASIFGGLSVAAGAFGSHALRDRLSDRALEIFETGAKYQMYHALALLAVGILLNQTKVAPLSLTIAGCAFIAGIVIFSGSLYALSLSGVKGLGAITPIGGAFFLVGWACLAIAGYATIPRS